MATAVIKVIYFASVIFVVTEAYRVNYVKNDRPIIGILAQERYPSPAQSEQSGGWEGNPNVSYIAASYVKFVEGAGARVVPILVNKDENYLREMFNSINGILYPGGAIYFGNDTSYNGGFYRSSLFLYNLAKEANDAGDYFPVWGTCMGFEFMLFAAAGNKEMRADCGAWNVVDKLKFSKDASSSRLFGKAPKSIARSLQSKPTAANFHHFCVTPENFSKSGLDEHYKILSTNYDASSNLEYVSAVESTKYPFFAVQFHPEKNLYEWTRKEKIPHFPEAMETAQYFANFFVNEARKNQHKFKSEEDEEENLIYNYSPDFTGANGSTFSQSYYFPF